VAVFLRTISPQLLSLPLVTFVLSQFTLFANSIEDSLGNHAGNLQNAMENLADTITASSDSPQNAFPFVKVDKFEIHGEHARDRSKVEAITFAPFVNVTTKPAWEEYSVRNQGWIQVSRDNFLDHLDDKNAPPVYLPGKISSFIYSRRDGMFAEPSESDFYAPKWYLSPPPFNPAIVNFDVNSEPEIRRIVQHVSKDRCSAFSPVMNVEFFSSQQVSDADHLAFHEQFTSITTAGSVGYSQPHSVIVHPVFDTNGDDDAAVAGVLLGSIAWDVFFADLLPEGVLGVNVVLRSSCTSDNGEVVGKLFSYVLNGAKPTYLGEGDLHEDSFTNLVRSIPMFVSGLDKEAPPGTHSICDYYVDVYPSKTFKQSFESNTAIIASVTVGATFVFVALIFFIYDKTVTERNRKATEAAERSNAVVNSMFPQNVRERIMKAANDNEATAREKVQGAAEGEVIADLYPDVTLMFGDIAGFTAWSSAREPAQVFTLLETLYSAFDEIARRRGIFKVETVGDCYGKLYRVLQLTRSQTAVDTSNQLAPHLGFLQSPRADYPMNALTMLSQWRDSPATVSTRQTS